MPDLRISEKICIFVLRIEKWHHRMTTNTNNPFTNTNNPSTIALVGLGQIAQHHIAGIQAENGLRLVAVCDIDADKKKLPWVTELTKQGVRFYDKIDDLILESNPEYVVIATPPSTHKELIQQTKAAGKTLVEKPILPSNEDIEGIDLEKVHTIYHWQYAPEVEAVREKIKDKKVKRIHVSICDPYISKRAIKPEHRSKGDAWTDSGINALSYVAAILSTNMDYNQNSILSKADHIQLEHLRYNGNCPIDSICRFNIDETRIVIHVKWGKKEKKISTIITEDSHYRVNHQERTIRNVYLGILPWIKTRLGNQSINRMDEHYIHFYGSEAWKQSNHIQTKTLLHIHHLYAQSFLYSLRAAHAHKRKKRVREIENWLPLAAAILGLSLFFIYIYFSPWEIHMPAWLGTANHGFRMMDFLVNALAALAGVIVTYYIYNWMQRYRNHYEDDIKVEYNDHVLFEQYGENNWKEGILNGTPFGVYYDPIFTHKEASRVKIEDKPNREDRFVLDNFIRFQYFSIRSAHASDSFKNEPTIRLQRVERPESGEIILHTHRANYLAHMLTNRAIDYKMNNMASLRQLFEYEATLTPLEHSLFANHIGINALIVLKYGEQEYILLPQRGNNATISKNMMTASVATRLKTGDYSQKLSEDCLQTLDNHIITKAMAISDSDWSSCDNVEIETRLIGGGRDIYEGGKPTMFYLTTITGLSLETYKQLPFNFKKHFDEIERIYIIPKNKLFTRNNHIRFEDAIVKTRSTCKAQQKQTIKPEKNLLALLWHYQQL